MLTDEMIEKRQQLEARVRRHIALNIEKKLASQYKYVMHYWYLTI